MARLFIAAAVFSLGLLIGASVAAWIHENGARRDHTEGDYRCDSEGAVRSERAAMPAISARPTARLAALRITLKISPARRGASLERCPGYGRSILSLTFHSDAAHCWKAPLVGRPQSICDRGRGVRHG
jgi:hypothetical protein